MADIFKGWPAALRALGIIGVVLAVNYALVYLFWPGEPRVWGALAAGIVLALVDRYLWNRPRRNPG